MPKKWYVVWRGRAPGVYASWSECSLHVDGYAGAIFKSFASEAEAEAAFRQPAPNFASSASAKPKPPVGAGLSEAELRRFGKPIVDSYCVDAACNGSPGLLEFRCVHTSSRAEIFRQGPFDDGTNNVGEFLAVVFALKWLTLEGVCAPVYSDSKNALKWVSDRQCRTKLAYTERNAPLFEMIAQAETWLRASEFTNRVLLWHTAAWGENPADFGRK